jgi:hypothetical protein
MRSPPANMMTSTGPSQLAEGTIGTVSSLENRNINKSTKRESGGTFSEIEVPQAYKSDNGLERGDEKLPSDPKATNVPSLTLNPNTVSRQFIASQDEQYQVGILAQYWQKYRSFGHAIIWLLVTA